MSQYIECLFIEIIQVGMCSIILGCVYRPPNTDVALFNSHFLTILTIINSGKNNIAIIAGDYNLDLLKYNTHLPTEEFLNNLLSHSMIPSIRYPTRISELSSTLIDNIFINSIHYDFNSSIIYNDISDHLPVAMHLKTKIFKGNKSEYPPKNDLINNESILNLNLELRNTNWDSVYNNLQGKNDPSHAYNLFYDIYRLMFDKHCPEQNFKSSYKYMPHHEWMTKGLIKSCVRKSKLYKLNCRNPSDEARLRYITYRNKLKSLLHNNNLYSQCSP